jgi:hypothetical protein
METLESRIALDSQGVLVGIDPHFALSFTPDGVAVGEDTSVLNATFDLLASRAAWREAILQGFQTWAVHTNADIAVVGDGGQPLGTPGASQHDDRFGDIRVAAAPLSPEVGAVSVPIGNVASGSWLADVVFNTSFDYASLADLLAVATHEAGNVFGLKDSADPASPLHAGVTPVVLPPTAVDIANLQELHGVRAPDKNEVHRTEEGDRVNDNNTLERATPLENAAATGLDEGTAPTIVFGDIGSNADLDFFTFTTPNDYWGPLTVTLRTSGVSLLRPSIELQSQDGVVVAQASSTSAIGSVLTVQLFDISPEETYTLRVAGAVADIFGIGGYSLAVTYDGLNVVPKVALDTVMGGSNRGLSAEDLSKLFDSEEDDFFNEDGGADDDPATASELTTKDGFANNSRYETIGSIIGASEVDHYTIKSPAAGGASAALDVMTVAVRSLNAGRLVPEVRVRDENGVELPAQVIVNGAGQVLVQLEGVQPSKDYSLRIAAADPTGPFAEGNYDLTVTFASEPAALETVAAGVVGGDVGETTHTLYVGRPQLFHFALATAEAAVAGPTAVIAIVKNDQGVVVAKVASQPGDTRSAPAVLLNAGVYTVEFFVLTLNGLATPSLSYDLRAQVLSDPFVGDPADPTNHPFACPEPELAGFFCYPGGFITSDPYLWDDFINSAAEAPPLALDALVDLLLGDWWSWVWEQVGVNGPTLAQNDRIDVQASGAAQAQGFALATTAPNVLTNDIDPEGGAVVAVLLTSPNHGTLTLDPDGTVHYTPTPGFVGVDRFTYTAYDFVQESVAGTAYLVVGSGLSGDFNGDGAIDRLDEAAWRAAYGSHDLLLADGNKNLVVDSADYTVWRDAFATVPATIIASAVDTDESVITTAVDAALDSVMLTPGNNLNRTTYRPGRRTAASIPDAYDEALLLFPASSLSRVTESPAQGFETSAFQEISAQTRADGGFHRERFISRVRPSWRDPL